MPQLAQESGNTAPHTRRHLTIVVTRDRWRAGLWIILGRSFRARCGKRAGGLARNLGGITLAAPISFMLGWTTGDRCVGGPGIHRVWLVVGFDFEIAGLRGAWFDKTFKCAIID